MSQRLGGKKRKAVTLMMRWHFHLPFTVMQRTGTLSSNDLLQRRQKRSDPFETPVCTLVTKPTRCYGLCDLFGVQMIKVSCSTNMFLCKLNVSALKKNGKRVPENNPISETCSFWEIALGVAIATLGFTRSFLSHLYFFVVTLIDATRLRKHN